VPVEHGAVEERSLPPALLIGAACLGSALVAGTAGLLVGVLTTVLAIVLDRRFGGRAPWVPWVLAAPCLVAAVAYGLRPWGGASGWAGQQAWVQYLALVPLAAVLASAAGRVRMSFRRRAGRSTKR